MELKEKLMQIKLRLLSLYFCLKCDNKKHVVFIYENINSHRIYRDGCKDCV